MIEMNCVPETPGAAGIERKKVRRKSQVRFLLFYSPFKAPLSRLSHCKITLMLKNNNEVG